ncbi:MAG: GGDEF domain-containing protein [Pseudomonadota bacterium]
MSEQANPTPSPSLVEIYTSRERLFVEARSNRFLEAYRHGTIDLASNFASAVVLTLLLAGQASAPVVLAWFVLVNIPSALRALLHRRLKSRRLPGSANRLLIAALFCSGVMWGLSFFLVPVSPPEYRLLIMLWLASSAAWIASAYGFVPEGIFAWLVAAMVPPGFAMLATGDQINFVLGAGTIVVYIPAMMLMAINNHRFLMQNQIAQRLNAELANELGEGKVHVENLNTELAADLTRREQTEIELREAKERAEQLAKELEKLSSLDGLTGIANRRRFDYTLEREWNRAARAQQPLALILVDIDHFKEYNDRYGHPGGDACLRQLATLLENSLRRGGDLAARYGGEEFAILLPDTNSGSAALVAEQIREKLENLGITHDRTPRGVLTASFGVSAMTPEASQSFDALLGDADRSLYRAKEMGRNRVVCDPLPQTPEDNENYVH